MIGKSFLIAAVLVPFVSFLLFKFQDGDFILMIYEKIGQDPAVALRGKVVWITGASSGIGEYLAYELVKYGCKLVLSARRKAELERVKKNCAGTVKCPGQSGFALQHFVLGCIYHQIVFRYCYKMKNNCCLFLTFLKKKTRIALRFPFWNNYNLFFRFRDTLTFLFYANEESDDVIIS